MPAAGPPADQRTDPPGRGQPEDAGPAPLTTDLPEEDGSRQGTGAPPRDRGATAEAEPLAAADGGAGGAPPAEEMPAWWWMRTGPATDSAYSSSDHEYPYRQPDRDTAGSRERAEERQEYAAHISRLGFREYAHGDTDQRGAADQSFFIAGATLHSLARGVSPDPDGQEYTPENPSYPEGHPAGLHTAEGVRGRIQGWLRADGVGPQPGSQGGPGRRPPARPGPLSRPGWEDLRHDPEHPGADSLIPLLARLCGRPVALVTRRDKRYRPAAPTITVYEPADRRPQRAVIQGPGILADIPRRHGAVEPRIHDMTELLILSRLGRRYTALQRLPNAPPTRVDGPTPWHTPEGPAGPLRTHMLPREGGDEPMGEAPGEDTGSTGTARGHRQREQQGEGQETSLAMYR